MSWGCAPVDADAGVVLRVAASLDCTAQSLGDQGFHALIGDSLMTGALSGLITILVAIFGYRFMLGDAPALNELVGRLVRLGFVLALVTGWPAFQTLVYDTATGAPEQLAATILPAASLSAGEDLPYRVQLAYDAIRLGSADGSPPPGASSVTQGSSDAGRPASAMSNLPPSQGSSALPAMGIGAAPQIASLFAAATIGLLSALHLATGFLLAVAPLGLIGLLFDGTVGLFNGWLRALAGSVLASLAVTAVTAIMLAMIENELVRWQHWRRGEMMMGSIDPQALSTLVYVGVVGIAVAVLAGFCMGGTIGYAPRPRGAAADHRDHRFVLPHHGPTMAVERPSTTHDLPGLPGAIRSRPASIADALARAARRDQPTIAAVPAVGANRDNAAGAAAPHDEGARGAITGQAMIIARRTSLRRSRMATQRDGVGR